MILNMVYAQPTGTIPEFTFSGSSKLVDEGDGNWKIRLLSSGTLKFTKLGNAKNGIDVFLVGGGNGGCCGRYAGGAGGRTTTKKGVTVAADTPYSVVIGAGGSPSTKASMSEYMGDSNYLGTAGGDTTAFNLTAKGGGTTRYKDGGCGGGSPAGTGTAGKGGSNGSDGENVGYSLQGSGQGTTTREFGDSNGTLYAGGGGGGALSVAGAGQGGDGGGGGSNNGYNGTANTGGGGGSTYYNGDTYVTPGKGGSGIVIIRNKRG